MIKVIKFGGTSVGTPARLKRAARAIQKQVQRGNGVIVVVSAMGNSTDEVLNLIDSLNGIDKPGMHEDAVNVRHDQKRGVLQCLVILEQLLISFVQISVLAFVLPSKEPLFPDISPALATACLGGTGLEGEPFALGVCLSRRAVADQAAQVDEMLLARRAFF